MSDPSRLARVRGVLGFAVGRTWARIRRTERTQIALSVGGVAIAVALLLLVTSVGVGLSASEAVRTSNADYAIIPSGGSSAVTDVGRARLGQSHDVARSLSRRTDVVHATAIRTELLRLVSTTDGSNGESVLVVGVSATRPEGVIAGLPVDALAPADPHYANGSYDGPFTGEMVLSASAAERLNTSEGDTLTPVTRGESNHSFSVTAIREPRRAGIGQLPVAIVHLSELQTVVGATGGDAADQLFVEANSPGVRSHLETIYPETIVVSRDDLFAGSDSRSNLPIAIAVAAFVVAIVVGTLFMVTTMGFELAADSEERAVMRAIGISGFSRALIVVSQALVVALVGGIVGVGLWLVGIGVANTLSETLASGPVAAFRPILAAYGVGAALLIGLLTVPYLLAAAWRNAPSDPTI